MFHFGRKFIDAAKDIIVKNIITRRVAPSREKTLPPNTLFLQLWNKNHYDAHYQL